MRSGNALTIGRTDEDDLAAVAAHAVDLDLRRVVGHYHDDARAKQLARACHGLGVVAARVRDHADLLLLVGQLRDGVEGAADLERPGRLEVLRLDETDVAEAQQRRPYGVAADAPGSSAHVVDGRERWDLSG